MLITASGGARGKKQVLLKQIADKGVKLAAEGGFKVTADALRYLRPPENPLSIQGNLNWYQDPPAEALPAHTHTCCYSAPSCRDTNMFSSLIYAHA